MSHTLYPLTFQHEDQLVTNLYPKHIAQHILQHLPCIPRLYHIQIHRHPPLHLPSSTTLYDYDQHPLSHYIDPDNPFIFDNQPFPLKIPTEQLPLNPYALKHKPNYINQAVRKYLTRIIDKQS